MSKRRKKTKHPRSLLAVFVVGVAVVGGLAYYVMSPGTRPDDSELRQASRQEQKDTPSQEQAKTYYRFDPARNWAKVVVKVPASEDPLGYVTNAYLRSLANVPSTVKVLSADVRNGEALMNFTSGLAASMGSAEETELINGILRIAGQFPEIETVDIMVDGEPLETGHQIYEDQQVIRPD